MREVGSLLADELEHSPVGDFEFRLRDPWAGEVGLETVALAIGWDLLLVVVQPVHHTD